MSFSISKPFCMAVALVAGLSSAGAAMAQSAPLSAQDSDPNVMGWMQGFPPPADKLITQPDSNYFSFPKLRWSVCHLREFLPTEEISRGLGAPARAGPRASPALGRRVRAARRAQRCFDPVIAPGPPLGATD